MAFRNVSPALPFRSSPSLVISRSLVPPGIPRLYRVRNRSNNVTLQLPRCSQNENEKMKGRDWRRTTRKAMAMRATYTRTKKRSWENTILRNKQREEGKEREMKCLTANEATKVERPRMKGRKRNWKKQRGIEINRGMEEERGGNEMLEKVGMASEKKRGWQKVREAIETEWVIV